MILYRPLIFCPVCHWRHPKRITGAMVDLAKMVDADTVLETQKCPKRGCDTIYPVAADAYQRAMEEKVLADGRKIA